MTDNNPIEQTKRGNDRRSHIPFLLGGVVGALEGFAIAEVLERYRDVAAMRERAAAHSTLPAQPTIQLYDCQITRQGALLMVSTGGQDTITLAPATETPLYCTQAEE